MSRLTFKGSEAMTGTRGTVLRVPRRNTVIITDVPVEQHCPTAPGFTSSDKRFHLQKP